MQENDTVRQDPRYEIAPVALRIAQSPAHPGRVERFTNSLRLMHRLDAIGCRRLVILEMVEGAERTPELQVDALNHYLRVGHGLRYFRRTHSLWKDAFAWKELRTLVGFSPIDALKPTSQIPA